jgi:hypothetical protein
MKDKTLWLVPFGQICDNGVMPGKSRAQQQAEAVAIEEGRCSKSAYHSGFDRRATDYRLLGATNEDLSRFFNVGISTIQRWLVEIPSFRRAVQRGREMADVRVARALHKRAVGFTARAQKVVVVDKTPQVIEYKEYYPPDVQAGRYWLNNRRPRDWKERDSNQIASAIDLKALVDALHTQRGDDIETIDGDATPAGAERKERL